MMRIIIFRLLGELFFKMRHSNGAVAYVPLIHTNSSIRAWFKNREREVKIRWSCFTVYSMRVCALERDFSTLALLTFCAE